MTCQHQNTLKLRKSSKELHKSIDGQECEQTFGNTYVNVKLVNKARQIDINYMRNFNQFHDCQHYGNR